MHNAGSETDMHRA